MNCSMGNFTSGFNFMFANTFFSGLLAPFMPRFGFFNRYDTFNTGFNNLWASYPSFNSYNPVTVDFSKIYTPTIDFSSIWNQPIVNTDYQPVMFTGGNQSYSFSGTMSDFYNDLGLSFSTKTKSTSEKSNTKTTKITKITKITDKDFNKMLDFVLQAEGGYVANDGGQATNKGIQQSTYDSYRKRKGLAKRDVKDISNSELKEIYYNDYYKASGADKIEDSRLALYVFDTAVNMGVSRAKDLLEQCDGDAEKFEKLRRAKYEEIAQNPKKSKYLKGWLNRVDNADNFATENFATA